jgi:hypothetical protein
LPERRSEDENLFDATALDPQCHHRYTSGSRMLREIEGGELARSQKILGPDERIVERHDLSQGESRDDSHKLA